MKIKNIFFLIATISLAACAAAPVFGLKPIYPKNECSKERIYFTEVDSLQPVLRWETFPPEKMQSDEEQMCKIRHITYDLKVWLSVNDSPSSVIYLRRDLPEPQDKIDQPLLPCARYFWTVRARFLVDGKERVSEWGISAWPYLRGVYRDEFIRRSPVVPPPNLYRFETPCPEKAKEGRTYGIP
jgi:hypothetical protein